MGMWFPAFCNPSTDILQEACWSCPAVHVELEIPLTPLQLADTTHRQKLQQYYSLNTFHIYGYIMSVPCHEHTNHRISLIAFEFSVADSLVQWLGRACQGTEVGLLLVHWSNLVRCPSFHCQWLIWVPVGIQPRLARHKSATSATADPSV